MDSNGITIYQFFVIFGFSAYVIIVFGVVIGWALNIYQRRKKIKCFYNSLIKGFTLNTIHTIEDVNNIYRGININKLENKKYMYDLSTLLRRFLVELHSKKYESLKIEQIHEWKEKIDDFIRHNEQLSPFSELPEAEKGMINDILSFAENKENEEIKRKIKELSRLIQVRKEEIDKIERSNKWSMPMGIVGIILTIIFGIASLK
ncbi:MULTISPECIES: hypothetical protein [Bacillus cereus group]|uniref:hypothetical protein n=1 Tax=Bacillus cereus group TaxID=86661 RepID=UPI0007FB40D7|nr:MULTISPECIES: hypothetical protein [Bacillus cereus group]MCP1399474.1 hypothetical protein [Bacillus cereus]OBW85223.1 hypothetical protein A9L49_28595 [Bacillus cereus]PER53192.1 hypothetical protein CN486_23220 [Bacillus thuringiensis]PFF67867.1 hypothetical protein CN334_12520 [Bacillus thuringiensis]PFT16984.1 hypothetical protein COK84_09700 [Bacillus thuringiensis]